MRRELSAGGVIVRRMRGRWWFAAIQPRREHRTNSAWALPKGLIDPGERGIDAAVREAYEETGLRTRVDSKLADSRYVYTWEGERIFKVVSFYLLRAVAGRIGELPQGMEREVEVARWLPLDEARTLLAHGGEREIAAKAIEVLRDNAL